MEIPYSPNMIISIAPLKFVFLVLLYHVEDSLVGPMVISSGLFHVVNVSLVDHHSALVGVIVPKVGGNLNWGTAVLARHVDKLVIPNLETVKLLLQSLDNFALPWPYSLIFY